MSCFSEEGFGSNFMHFFRMPFLKNCLGKVCLNFNVALSSTLPQVFTYFRKFYEKSIQINDNRRLKTQVVFPFPIVDLEISPGAIQ
jgi:hypothetical protein